MYWAWSEINIEARIHIIGTQMNFILNASTASKPNNTPNTYKWMLI